MPNHPYLNGLQESDNSLDEDGISDDEIFIDHIEVYDDEGENTLELDEMAAVQEEEFSEPRGLVGPHADFGFYDPEIIDAEMMQSGAGGDITPEDMEDLGVHMEIPLEGVFESLEPDEAALPDSSSISDSRIDKKS